MNARHARLQLHLPTCFAVTTVAAVLAMANTQTRRMETSSLRYVGWPDAIQYFPPEGPGESLGTIHEGPLYTSLLPWETTNCVGLAINLAVSLCLLIGSPVLCEWLLHYVKGRKLKENTKLPHADVRASGIDRARRTLR